MKVENELMRWLPSIAIFGGLQENTLKRLIALLQEHHVQAGDEICKEGETGRAMYLVREGEVMVCYDTPGSRRRKMVRLGPGEFFGEMTLIDIQKRSATVVAEKASTLYSLGNRELYKLYQNDVEGYVMVLQNLCRELSRRLRVTNRRLHEVVDEQRGDSDSTVIRPAIKR
jgi:CRP/FNR family cyclic AMP-dependent transcriptional regulator